LHGSTLSENKEIEGYQAYKCAPRHSLSLSNMNHREYLHKEGTFGIAKACKNDYQAVADMSDNIYNGFDYLLPIFHQWIDLEEEKSGQVRNFVLLNADQKVVGYQIFFILENGYSLFAQALRISPLLKGEGMGKLFDKLCKDYMKSFLSAKAFSNVSLLNVF